MKVERYGTVVIGGGQAGLAAGYYLRKAGSPFVILESNERIGDSWRKRWDSLRLFTPAEIDGLPGLPFPAGRWTFPTKDEVANYLESYAATFALPVRTSVHVTRLGKSGDGFVIETPETMYEAKHVIVASGAHSAPRIPDFALDLDARILQLHSSEYRNPTMLRPGPVLVVGAGNSGAEIALDISRSHRTSLAGRYQRAPGGPSRSPILTAILKPIMLHVITVDTPIGRKVRGKILQGGGTPVERVARTTLLAAGIEMLPRVESVRDGQPVLADGRTVETSNVIWCTGFGPGLEWIDLPVHDRRGEARQVRGVVPAVPGLYFLGRFFQYALISDAVGGVGRDARYVVDRIVRGTVTHASKAATRAARA
jgi:putative flavoprotein involved in K+ transport